MWFKCELVSARHSYDTGGGRERERESESERKKVTGTTLSVTNMTGKGECESFLCFSQNC